MSARKHDRAGTDGLPDIDTVVLDPYRYFDEPLDVTNAGDLDRAQKLRILKAMEHDAKRLQDATAENMTGGETHSLSAVLNAIEEVEASTS